MKKTLLLLIGLASLASVLPASAQIVANITQSRAGIAYNANSVRGIITMVKTDAGSTAHTPTTLTEGTDFFVHRESGNDFLVQMTDQSTKCGWGIVLHK